MLINILREKTKGNAFLSEMLTDKSLHQIKRYLITGFTSAAIELTLLFLLRDVIKLNLILANSIALTIIFWFNFLMNRIFSFKSKSDIRKQLAMYGLLYLFNLGASDLIVHLLTHYALLHHMLAKVLSIGAVVSWNFILYKKVIYK